MNGLVVGSGETTATWPRLCGLTTQTDSVKPCAGGGSSPSCSNIAATMWNWTSGAARSSRVRRKPPDSATLDDSGPPPCAHSARFSSVSASLRLTGSSQMKVAPKAGWSCRPEADARDLGDGRDLQQRELVGAPDPRQPEDLRREVRAGRDDDLALGAELEQLAQPRADDADGAGAVEEHPVGVEVGLDGEVRAVHDRVQVGDRGAAAPAVARGELVPAEAVLARAVEVLAGGQPARGRRVEEGLRQPGARERVRDAQRPADGVVLGGAAHVVLGAQEVGQHVVPAPPQLAPLVVVGRVAADVDHRVDRRGAAERLAARQIDAAVVETRLEPGAEVPVRARAVVGREGGRDVDEVRRVRRPGLQEQDLHIGVLAEPVGEHAARRARADDHVVVHARHTRARSTPCQPATAASAGAIASRRSMTSRAWRV